MFISPRQADWNLISEAREDAVCRFYASIAAYCPLWAVARLVG